MKFKKKKKNPKKEEFFEVEKNFIKKNFKRK